jgi:hypothetical protein
MVKSKYGWAFFLYHALITLEIKNSLSLCLYSLFTSAMSTSVSKFVWEGRIPLAFSIDESEAQHFGAEHTPSSIFVSILPILFTGHSTLPFSDRESANS